MTHKMLSRPTGPFSQMSTELITNSRQTRFHTLQQLRDVCSLPSPSSVKFN
jgi:hypothetical protein